MEKPQQDPPVLTRSDVFGIQTLSHLWPIQLSQPLLYLVTANVRGPGYMMFDGRTVSMPLALGRWHLAHRRNLR